MFHKLASNEYVDYLKSRARRLPNWMRSPLKRLFMATNQLQNRQYQSWVQQYDTLTPSDVDAIRRHVNLLRYKPLLSVVMPVYNPPTWALRAAIESIREQLYPNWELCIADDASPDRHVQALLEESTRDPRIKLVRRAVNGNISAASNSALSLVQGEFVALMDHDDVLASHALYEVVVALNDRSDLDIIYSDEDQIDRQGRRQTPYFKTDWNKELFLGHNLISHLGVYRRSLLESVGGFRLGFEGSQDYDLALRCIESSSRDRIHHIPTVLYHWRREFGASSFSEARSARCAEAARRAIDEHLQRGHENAVAQSHPVLPHWVRVRRTPPRKSPSVTLIVPTLAGTNSPVACARGLLEQTDYPNVEFVVVDHESQSTERQPFLQGLGDDLRVRTLTHRGAFNYSAMINMAARQANGAILGLLSDDIEVINPGWLSEMVSWAVRDDVGAVGAKLVYSDGRVRHGGLALGLPGIANPFNYRLRRSAAGYFGRNALVSEVSAVTGACLLVRRSVFEQVGGLDEINLPVTFSDVDFCLKLRRRGYRNIWTPHAELYHHQSRRDNSDAHEDNSKDSRGEAAYMLKTWNLELSRDPFHNDNLATDATISFELAFPPRRRKPWQEQLAARDDHPVIGQPVRKEAQVQAGITSGSTPAS
ncbi:glycosyltransferase family 2 protein [Bradyrhizobium sp. DASA03120]|uniref:glycosyltransferase family 2 protein n=1 Tax=Bradyrhizobium sp. SMVTL-02 TaxID=3395917 RepID=UPI003F708626